MDRGHGEGSVVDQASKVTGICGFSKCIDGDLDFGGVHPAVPPCNFLKAGDFETLVVLDGADEPGGFEQGLVGAGSSQEWPRPRTST
jgi:hypothetical protein